MQSSSFNKLWLKSLYAKKNNALFRLSVFDKEIDIRVKKFINIDVNHFNSSSSLTV